MTSKLKILAAGFALAFTGAASASIPDEGTFLMLNNNATNNSYFLNLGYTLYDFQAGLSDKTWDLTNASTGAFWDANFNGASVSFNVTAQGYPQDGALESYNVTHIPALVNGAQTVFQLEAVAQNVYNKVLALNSAAAGGNYGLVTSTSSPASYSFQWGNNVNSTVPNTTSAGLDTLLPFYSVTVDPGNPSNRTTVALLGNFSLSSAGLLTYNPVTAVPIPAAAWLMGSAVTFLFGFARRRKGV